MIVICVRITGSDVGEDTLTYGFEVFALFNDLCKLLNNVFFSSDFILLDWVNRKMDRKRETFKIKLTNVTYYTAMDEML